MARGLAHKVQREDRARTYLQGPLVCVYVQARKQPHTVYIRKAIKSRRRVNERVREAREGQREDESKPGAGMPIVGKAPCWDVQHRQLDTFSLSNSYASISATVAALVAAAAAAASRCTWILFSFFFSFSRNFRETGEVWREAV